MWPFHRVMNLVKTWMGVRHGLHHEWCRIVQLTTKTLSWSSSSDLQLPSTTSQFYSFFRVICCPQKNAINCKYRRTITSVIFEVELSPFHPLNVNKTQRIKSFQLNFSVPTSNVCWTYQFAKMFLKTQQECKALAYKNMEKKQPLKSQPVSPRAPQSESTAVLPGLSFYLRVTCIKYLQTGQFYL